MNLFINFPKTVCSQDQDIAGRVILKQVQQSKSSDNKAASNISKNKNGNNLSIDLTDDIEDGNQSSESMNGLAQPPALVAFRGNNSQANSINKTKPTTTYYVKPNSTPNKSIDKIAVIPANRLVLRNGKLV